MLPGTDCFSLLPHSVANSLIACRIYRSRSLMQSYELNQADTAVAITGHQNISFRYSSNEPEQRIDRRYTPSSKSAVWTLRCKDPR